MQSAVEGPNKIRRRKLKLIATESAKKCRNGNGEGRWGGEYFSMIYIIGLTVLG